jgi:hypothetical protein
MVHLTVSQHHGWPNLTLPTPPPLNPIFQAAPNHSPVQSSHARKRLNIESHHEFDKGKAIASPSSPSDDSDKSMSSWIHLRDNCSHVINEINPKGSAHVTHYFHLPYDHYQFKPICFLQRDRWPKFLKKKGRRTFPERRSCIFLCKNPIKEDFRRMLYMQCAEIPDFHTFLYR